MFQSDTHLPHILAPVHYSDPGLLEREVQKLMMPAWHCIGNIDDLSQGKECYRFDLFDIFGLCCVDRGPTFFKQELIVD